VEATVLLLAPGHFCRGQAGVEGGLAHMGRRALLLLPLLLLRWPTSWALGLATCCCWGVALMSTTAAASTWVGCSAWAGWAVEWALVASLALLLLLLVGAGLMLFPVSHRGKLPHCCQELLQGLKGLVLCCELHLLLQSWVEGPADEPDGRVVIQGVWGLI
jgi:hypothetical protein